MTDFTSTDKSARSEFYAFTSPPRLFTAARRGTLITQFYVQKYLIYLLLIRQIGHLSLQLLLPFLHLINPLQIPLIFGELTP